MAPINVFENGLNVQYIPDFIEKDQADDYFNQLKSLPFYTPTFKICGKTAKPKRQVLAYGDANLSYSFSGTSIPANPWIPLMSELRDRMEKFTSYSFNYVLLNQFTDGTNYVSQHKDNESRMDTTMPIFVLSFGAERTIEFKKPNTPSTLIKLEHGSLFTMLHPTNKMFTHGIAPEPNVKEMRISLTFLLLTNPMFQPLKKARLETHSSVNTVEKNNLPASSTNNCEKDWSPANSCEKDFSPLMEYSNRNDCLSDLFHQNDSRHPLLKQWNLNRNTFLKIVLDTNCNLRLHIRCFKEPKSGEFIPTKQGIIMTPSTWNCFVGNIQNFKFHSVHDTFVCNNQLLVAYVDNEFCMLQQIYPLNCPGFFLKPTVLYLFKDQIFKLLELAVEITETIMEAMFIIQLPKLILSQSSVCFSHLNIENARRNFINCISLEIISRINMIECDDCFDITSDKSTHACAKPVLDRFNLNKQDVLLSLNLYNVIKKLKSICMCHYDTLFFKQFTFKLYKECIKEVLEEYENKP